MLKPSRSMVVFIVQKRSSSFKYQAEKELLSLILMATRGQCWRVVLCGFANYSCCSGSGHRWEPNYCSFQFIYSFCHFFFFFSLQGTISVGWMLPEPAASCSENNLLHRSLWPGGWLRLGFSMRWFYFGSRYLYRVEELKYPLLTDQEVLVSLSKSSPLLSRVNFVNQESNAIFAQPLE